MRAVNSLKRTTKGTEVTKTFLVCISFVLFVFPVVNQKFQFVETTAPVYRRHARPVISPTPHL